MRYLVTNLKELVELLPELDDQDRITFKVYNEDRPVGRDVVEYTFRFTTGFIKLHEIKEP